MTLDVTPLLAPFFLALIVSLVIGAVALAAARR
jgi:hypothetical protein